MLTNKTITRASSPPCRIVTVQHSLCFCCEGTTTGRYSRTALRSDSLGGAARTRHTRILPYSPLYTATCQRLHTDDDIQLTPITPQRSIVTSCPPPNALPGTRSSVTGYPASSSRSEPLKTKCPRAASDLLHPQEFLEAPAT